MRVKASVPKNITWLNSTSMKKLAEARAPSAHCCTLAESQ